MSNGVLVTALGGVISSAIAALVAFLIAKTNSRTTVNAAMTAPYETLAGRVDKLEKQRDEDYLTIEMLKDQLHQETTSRRSLTAYIRVIVMWATSGAHPPPPDIPIDLRGFLDPEELFENPRLVRRTTTTEYVDPRDPSGEAQTPIPPVS